METKQPTLTADQQEAAALIEAWYLHLNTQIFVLCGYAGTGKTFLIDYVVRSLGLVAGESAAFVAPTGKAASVLIQGGVPATTVHSLIYTREEDIEVDENGEVISEQFLRFTKREYLDSRIKLIVLDETSMVSDDVLRDLLSFGIKCLCCGDPAQLPPVGGSNTLLSAPVITLREIVRQERDNPIVRLAARVRAGVAAAPDEGAGVAAFFTSPEKPEDTSFILSFNFSTLPFADQSYTSPQTSRRKPPTSDLSSATSISGREPYFFARNSAMPFFCSSVGGVMQ